MTRPGDELDLPCPAWCQYQDARDESCLSTERRTALTLHDRIPYGHGEGPWGDSYVTVYAIRSRLNRTEGVFLGRDDGPGATLTPGEARAIAADLLRVADNLEAKAAQVGIDAGREKSHEARKVGPSKLDEPKPLPSVPLPELQARIGALVDDMGADAVERTVARVREVHERFTAASEARRAADFERGIQ